jgi:hypothetical protein
MGLLAGPDWEITATTVYCEAVGDEVTLMVYANGTCKCTWREKYSGTAKKTKLASGVKKPECAVDCSILNRYRDSLLKSQ